MAATLGTNIFEAGTQSGKDGGQGANQRDDARGGDGARAHRPNVSGPELIRRHIRNGDRAGVDGVAAGKLAEEFDRGNHDEPGDDASREKKSGNAGTDDVADAEILGGDVRAEGCAGKPFGLAFRLRGPGLEDVHEDGVYAAESKAPENASGKRTATLACNKDVSTGSTFGEGEVAVLLDDELTTQGNHEQHAEPSAEKRERENPPEGELGAEAEKDERGNREHDAGGERFAGRASGLDDVVLEDCRTSKRAQDADGEYGDGNGCGDGEAGAQADVDAHRAKEQTKQGAQDHSANRKFLEGLLRGDVGAKFSWRGRGTPWTIGH